MLDRNKTRLTHDVTQAAIKWLDAKGFKPIETEVPVASGWVADVAAMLVPTQTELINLGLIERRPSWRRIRAGNGWNTDKIKEWKQKLAMRKRTMACVVEVKTSKSDFRTDKKWMLDSLVADLMYLAVPKGMLKPEQWPERWGILECSNDGIKCVQRASVRQCPLQQQFDVALSIAVRRDHFTRYARWREYEKKQRLERAASTSHFRVSACLRAVLDIAEGRAVGIAKTTDPQSILRYYGIKTNLTGFELDRLEAVAKLAAKEEQP